MKKAFLDYGSGDIADALQGIGNLFSANLAFHAAKPITALAGSLAAGGLLQGARKYLSPEFAQRMAENPKSDMLRSKILPASVSLGTTALATLSK